MFGPNYKKYQTLPYKIAELEHADKGANYRHQLEKGHCHGFTYAMVDPDLSPYKNPAILNNHTNQFPIISINQKIRNYQDQQYKPTANIRSTRMTRRHFCPNSQKQVEEIYAIAERHIGKELCVTLRRANGAHSVYLCVIPGAIRYMDANHGAYLFRTKTDFFDFYVNAKPTDPNFSDYTCYQITSLTYDANQTLHEPETIAGKIRTLLTGPKYFSIGSVIFACLLAGLTAYLGMLVGAAALCFIGIATIQSKLLAGIIVLSLQAKAMQSYSGLLAIPHYLKESWYRAVSSSEKTHQRKVAPNTNRAPSSIHLPMYKSVTSPCAFQALAPKTPIACERMTSAYAFSLFKSKEIGIRPPSTPAPPTLRPASV